MDKAREYCATMDKNQRGLFFHGPQGRGKTSMSTAVLRVELERFLRRESPYRSIQHVFVPDLAIELQSCFSHGSEKMPGDVIYRVASYDFLVLDGAGEGGKQSDFVVGAMGTLFHHRDADRKSKRTVITSNYDHQALAERMDARIVSRVLNMCESLPFSGEDKRVRK